MTFFGLAIVIVAGIGLYQSVAQRIAHKQLNEERRQRYMQRLAFTRG